MTFTIITIIFLPLSFMSSIFGMNARELSGPDGGVMSLKYQFKVMCKSQPLFKSSKPSNAFLTNTTHMIVPISIGLILLSLILAFSSWIQNAFTSLVRQPRIIQSKIKKRQHRNEYREAKEQAKAIEKKLEDLRQMRKEEFIENREISRLTRLESHEIV